MDYTIAEVSKLLNISRVTIYKKVEKLKDLQKHIIVKSNGKYIDAEGVEIIRQSIIDNQQIKPSTSVEEENIKPFTNIEEEEKPENEDSSNVVNDIKGVNNQDELIKSLKEQIDNLKKDKDDLKKDKEKLYSIIHNTQVLLKDSQDHNQRLLMSVNESKNDNIIEEDPVNIKSKLNPLNWFKKS